MACEPTEFQDEIKVKILAELPPCANCGGTEEVVAIALVRYDGTYCHIGSAEFTAKPTGIPPCSDEVPGEETPPEEPPPNPDPDGDDETPDDETDPPVPDPDPSADLPAAPDTTVIPYAVNPPVALRVVSVTNQAELDAALLDALPGDWIKLSSAGVFTGMVIRKSGTAANPIVISGYNGGSLASVVGAGAGNGVDIGDSSYVQLRAFNITNFNVAINTGVAGNVTNCVFDNLGITVTGAGAISFRDNSFNNYVQRCTFDSIGGKSISIGDVATADGCNNNNILGNSFDGSVKEAVDINVAAVGTVVWANAVNAIDIVLLPAIQSAILNEGTDSVFKDNTVTLSGFGGDGFLDKGTRSRYNSNTIVGTVGVDHYGYNFEDITTTANHTFECDNIGTSNKTCGPEIIIDPPDPLPDWPLNRFAFGMMYSPSGSGRAGTEPCPDYGCLNVNNNSMLELNKAAAGGYVITARLPPNSQCRTQAGDPELDPGNALYDPTAKIDGYNIRRAKAAVANLATKITNANQWYDDGVLRCAVLFDDAVPGASNYWNGRPPTGNEADELARYLKSFSSWSKVPTAFRGPTAGIKQMKSVWNYMDIAWVQVKKNQWGPARSTIKSEIEAEIARAKSMGMSFMGIGNLLNQGSGIDWTLGEDAGKIGCSPDDIMKLGDVLAEIGDYKMLGAFFWGDTNFHPTYFLRSDIQAALAYMHDKVRDIKIGPPNWRDFD